MLEMQNLIMTQYSLRSLRALRDDILKKCKYLDFPDS